MRIQVIAIWLASLAGICTSIGVIWIKGVRPVSNGVKKVKREISEISSAVPVLMGIADEFKNNGGSTLKDRLDQICAKLADVDRRLEEVTTNSTSASDIARAAKLVADTNAAIVHELALVAGEDESSFKDQLDRLEEMLQVNADRLTELETVQREKVVPNVIRRRSTDADPGPWPGTEE